MTDVCMYLPDRDATMSHVYTALWVKLDFSVQSGIEVGFETVRGWVLWADIFISPRHDYCMIIVSYTFWLNRQNTHCCTLPRFNLRRRSLSGPGYLESRIPVVRPSVSRIKWQRRGWTGRHEEFSAVHDQCFLHF